MTTERIGKCNELLRIREQDAALGRGRLECGARVPLSGDTAPLLIVDPLALARAIEPDLRNYARPHGEAS